MIFSIAILVISCVLVSCTGKVNPPPCLEVGQTWRSPVDGAELVCVPAGEFYMGAADDDLEANENEKPGHRVFMDAYWIDKYEVTNGQFALCVKAGVCRRSEDPGGSGVASRTRTGYYYDEAYRNYPVLVYTGEEAQAYCAWAGRRLPSEAEWEKAARGTDRQFYPWGDAQPDCEIVNARGCYADTTEAGRFPHGNSPYGAADMAGNVWEWVADTYDSEFYGGLNADNPTGPDYDGFQVRRGGGWRSLLTDLRATRRASGQPHHYFDGQMGFRCGVSSP